MTRNTSTLPEEKLGEIMDRYDQPELRVSTAYSDAGTDPLWSRFSGGVINQMEGGEAMSARYAIWANTVRDNVIEGMKAMEVGNTEAGRHHLIRAANSLSAFADIQAYFDSFNLGERT
jgi:hypothetical protein